MACKQTIFQISSQTNILYKYKLLSDIAEIKIIAPLFKYKSSHLQISSTSSSKKKIPLSFRNITKISNLQTNDLVNKLFLYFLNNTQHINPPHIPCQHHAKNISLPEMRSPSKELSGNNHPHILHLDQTIKNNLKGFSRVFIIF